jgi:hypothetical protein
MVVRVGRGLMPIQVIALTMKSLGFIVIKKGLDVLRQAFESIRSVLAIVAEPRMGRFPRSAGRVSRIAILGTGPSLRDTFRDLDPAALANVALMSVNEGYKAEHFVTLKPSYHLIADPIYWDEASYNEHARPLVAALAHANWDITLFMPSRSRGSRIHAALTAANTTVVFYRRNAIKGLPVFEYLAFSAMLGMPKPQNVLVAGISVALWMGFEEVGIAGADHTWHQDIELSDENILMVRQMHSYDDRVDRKPFLKPSGVRNSLLHKPLSVCDTFSVREIFLAWAIVHESYEKLRAIAKRSGVHVWNCSSTTFIDAFERKSFHEFVG